MIHLVWELYDGQNHREECAEILANAYMFNNPFVKPLKLTKQMMLEDFLKQLDNKTFKYVFIFFEANLYYQGLKEIVGLTCTGDILDFQNSKDDIDYDRVPQSSLVRSYMRQKTLEPFWKQYKNKINQNEYFYGGNFGIKPKYMGRGMISYYMCLQVMSYMRSVGFKCGIVNAINQIAKRLFDNLQPVMRETVVLENMQILSDQSFPFKDLGLNQVLYVGGLDFPIQMCQKIIDRRLSKL